MGYSRSSASVFGTAIELAFAIGHHIIAEDHYGVDPGPAAFAEQRKSAEVIVQALLQCFNVLDHGGRRILAEAAARAAADADRADEAVGGF